MRDTGFYGCSVHVSILANEGWYPPPAVGTSVTVDRQVDRAREDEGAGRRGEERRGGRVVGGGGREGGKEERGEGK